MSLVITQQGLKQALTVAGRPVVEVLVSPGFIDQARIPEDAQVATDPGLLALGDQAGVTDAQLAGIAQQLQDLQAMGIAQSLTLSSQTSSALEVEKSRAQLPPVRGING